MNWDGVLGKCPPGRTMGAARAEGTAQVCRAERNRVKTGVS